MIHQVRLCLVVFLLLASTHVLNASIVVTIDSSSGNLVVTASGDLDLLGTSVFMNGGSYTPGVIPGGDNWFLAPGPGTAFETYALVTADAPFGTSTSFFDAPDSTSGDSFFLFGSQGTGIPQVGLPTGYTSGDPIFSQMTFNNTSIADLTLLPGNYQFTLPNDQITMVVVPEPSSGSGLFFFFLLAAARRRVETRPAGSSIEQ